MLFIMLSTMWSCRPNDELVFCKDELRTISDTIEYNVFANPEWRSLFEVDGAYVPAVLNELADRLDSKLHECPCIGTCSFVETCVTT